MTLEEGKPLPEATGEVHRAATLLAWDCEEGRRAYGRIIPSPTNEVLSVRQVPVGPVGALVPWNFPAGGPMRKIAASLSAGCSIVIKPSEEIPGTFRVPGYAEAGVPAGVLNLVFGVRRDLRAAHRLARSGSSHSPARYRSASISQGSRRQMKPSMMELGGHAPVIVCADTDPVAATRTAVAKVVNSGQVCTSPSRFVDEAILPAYIDAFVAAIRRSGSETGSRRACRWARS